VQQDLRENLREVNADIETSKKVPMSMGETPLRFGDTAFPT